MAATPVSAFYKSSILIGLDKFVSIQQLPLDVNLLKLNVRAKERLFAKIAESRDYTIFEEQPT